MSQVDEELITVLDQAFLLPCDFSKVPGWPDTTGPAKWIVEFCCPDCLVSYTGLLCNDCWKCIFNSSSDEGECLACDGTGHSITKWILSINPI